MLPGGSSTPIFLGCAGIPAPSHRPCLYVVASPSWLLSAPWGTKLGVWRFGGEGGRWPRIPSSSGRAAPSVQAVRGVQKQLRRFGLPPARTPSPLWGW